jgi:hypothetical protein
VTEHRRPAFPAEPLLTARVRRLPLPQHSFTGDDAEASRSGVRLR